MGQALLFGLIGSSALVIGGSIGAYWKAPQQVSGVLLAFASGTLISALAFELFPEAVHLGGLWPAGLGLLAGAYSSIQYLPGALPVWAFAAGVGGLIGSELGSRRLQSKGIRRALATVLVIAGLKLMLT